MKPVYTFADLEDWEKTTTAEPLPLRLAVIGDPVAHSASPPMHNAALHACGIPAAYCRLHLMAHEVPTALRLLPKKGFIGVNCTIPHKAAALAAMDDVDDHARLAGGVNTIRIAGDGKLQGFSTDGLGLERAVREQLDADLREMRVLILGAGGGAGHAVAMHCAATRVRELSLVNRTIEKLRPMQEALAPIYPRASLTLYPWNEEALAKALAHTDLVINCSSLGMKPDDPSPIPGRLLNKRHLLYDTIYTVARTPLVRAAEEAGARAANGLDMLLHQGAISFQIWFGREAPLDVMRAALLEYASSREP